MPIDLTALLPIDKMDTEAASKVVAIGFPGVEPVLPKLLEWLQDMNWPVAQVLQPFLASVGAPLAVHIRAVLATDDDVWKYWVVQGVVGESMQLMHALKPELERLAHSPTDGEAEEGVSELSAQIIKKVRGANGDA
jgi:hypothetical protein